MLNTVFVNLNGVTMNKRKRWTHDEFVDSMSIINADIEILGKFLKRSLRIEVKCKHDGHIWNPTCDNLLRGSGCPVCSNNKKRSADDWNKEIKNKFPYIEIITEFVSKGTPMKFRCNRDGHEWEACPPAILSSINGCPKCGNNVGFSHEEFLKLVYENNPDVTVISNYKNAYGRIQLKCKEGHEINVIAGHLMHNKISCPICKPKAKTNEMFVTELKEKNPTIIPIEEYTTNATKIKVKCAIDGQEWFAAPIFLLRGQGCPKCRHKGGYSIARKGYFYICAFDNYIGFGITNNPSKRISSHVANFKQHGIQNYKVLLLFSDDSHEIFEFEKSLKKSLPIVNTDIPGFKTEAISCVDVDLLFNCVTENFSSTHLENAKELFQEFSNHKN